MNATAQMTRAHGTNNVVRHLARKVLVHLNWQSTLLVPYMVALINVTLQNNPKERHRAIAPNCYPLDMALLQKVTEHS
jgi:hypothetical protein